MGAIRAVGTIPFPDLSQLFFNEFAGRSLRLDEVFHGLTAGGETPSQALDQGQIAGDELLPGYGVLAIAHADQKVSFGEITQPLSVADRTCG